MQMELYALPLREMLQLMQNIGMMISLCVIHSGEDAQNEIVHASICLEEKEAWASSVLEGNTGAENKASSKGWAKLCIPQEE